MLWCFYNHDILFFSYHVYRFDTEISTLSPPNQDDSFFYIPYSKLAKANPPGQTSCVSSANSPSIGTGSEASGSSLLGNKHTTPCLKFLGEGKNMGEANKKKSSLYCTKSLTCIKILSCSDIADLTGFSKDGKKISKPVKSFGTDDGFKSEAAQCGHSVVQVNTLFVQDSF